MSVRTLAKTLGLGKFATGTYTGDGAATQAIAGVGFQPKFVIIYQQVDSVDSPGWEADVDVGFTLTWWANVYNYSTDHIVSLDADGFTVGDGTGLINIFNILDVVYSYVCFG